MYHMSDNSLHFRNGRNGILCLFFNIFSVQEFSKMLPICFSDVSLTLSSYVKFGRQNLYSMSVGVV